jgi:hypothetical protein
MTEREKNIDKIQKLLAMAESPYEKEAETAMRLAGKLLAKNGLTMEEVRAQKMDESRVTMVKYVTKADRTGWLGNLSYSVSKTFDCNSLRGRGSNTRSHVLIFIGVKKDVEMAVHFFSYFKDRVDSLASQFERNYGKGFKGQEVDAYRVGVVKTLSRRLREAFEAKVAATNNCTDLVLLKDQMIRKFQNDQFPKVNKSRSLKTHGSHDAYNRGRRDGEGISIHTPVSGGAGRVNQIGR